jgi:MFS family permease
MSTVAAEFFGTRHHGFILGFVIFFGSLGGAISPFLSGYIYDVTMSYEVAFLILLALSVVGFVMILFTKQKPRGYGYNV